MKGIKNIFTKSLAMVLSAQTAFAAGVSDQSPRNLDLSYSINANIPKTLKAYIQVGGKNQNPDWARKQCDLLYYSLNLSEKVSADCDWNRNDVFFSPALNEARNSGDYDLYVDSYTDENGTLRLRAVNWKQKGETEFSQVGWNIEPNQDLLPTVGKLMTHVVKLKTESVGPRTTILSKLSKDSQNISYDEKNNAFQSKLTGENLTLTQAESEYLREGKANKDYLTAAVEIFAIMGIGLYGYTSQKETMMRDWDYPTRGDSFSNLMNGNKIRFDDNSFRSTNWPHTYAAVPEYLLCRANGLSNGESFLCSLAASLTWETIIEYREVLSINDMITTTMGGFVIGESFFQLGRLFKSKRGNDPMNKIFSTIFSSPDKFNRYVQKNVTHRHQSGFETLSNEPEIFGQAELYVQMDTKTSHIGGKEGNPIWAGFNGKTISIDGWNSEGNSSGFQKETAASEFLLEGVQNAPKAGQDFHIMSKIAFAAYKQKRLHENAYGQLEGYQFYVGPASGIESRQNEDDFFGVINILGTTAHIEMFSKGYKITAELEFFGDFAMVNSSSLAEYKLKEDPKGLPTAYHGDYYYAVGTTTRGQIVLEKDRVAFGVGFSSHDWQNVGNGRYRFQESVTTTADLKDQQSEVEAFVKYKISKNLQIRFSTSIIKRSGSANDTYQQSSSDRRVGIRLSYLF